MTFLSKITLYLTSFLPLFLIILLLDFKWFSWFPSIFYHTFFFWITILILCISIIFLLVFLYAIKKIWDNLQLDSVNSYFEIKNNDNSNILLYLLNYVIPFLWIPEKKLPYVLFIMLIVSFVVFIRSDLKKYNFTLLLLWYNIYEAKLKKWDDEEYIYIISKYNISRLRGIDKLYFYSFDNKIYFI